MTCFFPHWEVKCAKSRGLARPRAPVPRVAPGTQCARRCLISNVDGLPWASGPSSWSSRSSSGHIPAAYLSPLPPRHEAQRLEQEARGRLERQKILDQAEAEKARRDLLELEALRWVQKTKTAAAEGLGKAAIGWGWDAACVRMRACHRGLAGGQVGRAGLGCLLDLPDSAPPPAPRWRAPGPPRQRPNPVQRRRASRAKAPCCRPS